MTEFKIDTVRVKVFPTRYDMGVHAASEVSKKIIDLLSQKRSVNMVFAAAPSQNEFLNSLVEQQGIDWSRVNAFHMDEYLGLSDDAPQGFGNFLREKIFNKVQFGSVHFLNGNTSDPKSECKRYADLLARFPTDIVCMGIGENTHIAFNDPHVADFNDMEVVKIVELDNACRQQQVNDGCFQRFEQVPKEALTLTIPALVSTKFIFCMVPGKNKANAVNLTLTQKISETFPASILRKHQNCQLFLDLESSAQLNASKSIEIN